PMLLTDRTDFRDFHARIEAKINEGGDSGFFFRFGDQGDKALQAQITTAAGAAGSLLWDAATVVPGMKQIAPETWFRLEVIAQGPRITVLVDGEQVVNWTYPSREIPAGPFAFESGFPGTEFRIRKVEVKSPSDVAELVWQPLFNGRDLTGWKQHPQQPGDWHVENGVLVGTGAVSHLFTKRSDFHDFEFRCDVRLNANGNSGVFLRTPFAMAEPGKTGTSPAGYEVQLVEGNHLDPKQQYLSGGLIPIANPISANLIHAGQWHKVRVKAVGDQFDVWIDDVQTVSATDPTSRRYRGGHLALQVWTPGTKAEFRNIEVRTHATTPTLTTSVDFDPSHNYALSFDGQDDSVEIPGLKYDGSHPITVEYRAKSTGNDDHVQRFVVSNGDEQERGFSVYERGNRYPNPQFTSWGFAYSDRAFGRGSLVASMQSWAIDKPSHVAVAIDGPNWKFFIDGGLWRHGTMRDAPSNSAKPFFMGRHPVLGGYFHGVIDEVRISNVARYTENFTPAERFEPDEHTLALYHFDDGAGDVLTDSSGNGRHGKIIGAKWVRVDVQLRASEPTKENGLGQAAFPPPPVFGAVDADTIQRYQAAYAASLRVPLEWTNPAGMTFRLIPSGQFLMGSTADESQNLSRALEQARASDYDKFAAQASGPQHPVWITQPFYCGVYEVTVGEYRQFVEATKYLSTMQQLGVKRFEWTSSIAEPNADRRAVIGVSWDDAQAFCRWRSEQDGVTYGLPSEAQWEYACRAGTTTLWSFGDDAAQLADHAVFGRESFWPAEVVGSRKPNAFGLFDMHGNADEWCLDW
ncbi:MAG TPA: family 16 glycoside hydrolase, partial [Planctomycetaceae bacterium]|nr:family 16 glycoside hydrolase [Planctomycetaceae bacterium]